MLAAKLLVVVLSVISLGECYEGRAANDPSVFTITERVKNDGSLAALVTIVPSFLSPAPSGYCHQTS